MIYLFGGCMKKLFIALISVILLLVGCSDLEITCDNCMGKGYIFFDNNYHRETCPTCGGSGKLKSN